MLSPSHWLVLRKLLKQPLSIAQLARILQRSPSWTSEIVEKLEQEGFVLKEKKGITVLVALAKTPPAIALQRLLVKKQAIPFEKYAVGKSLLVLFSLIHESKSVQELSWTCNLNQQMVHHYLRRLIRYFVLGRDKKRYVLPHHSFPELWDFLQAYRHFSPVPGSVVWKLGDEVLFETRHDVDAQPTGFTAFSVQGVRMHTVKGTYYLPKRKLSVAEIGIHALATLDDPRSLALVIVFFLKNKLTPVKMELLAAKYDCRERLRDLFIVIRSTDGRIVTKSLPAITRRELDETLKMYGVYYVQTG